MIYPMWSYFPRNVRPPAWASSFVEVVKSAEGKISIVDQKTGLDCNTALSHLGPGLVALGYAVKSGKTKQAKVHRPVLLARTGLHRSTMRSTPSTMSSASRWRWKRAVVRPGTRTTGISSARP